MDYRLVVCSTILFLSSVSFGQNDKYLYDNKNCGIRIHVLDSCDIKLNDEAKFDFQRGQGIIDFSLPKIWSDLENQDIENAISITYLLSPKINSLQELEANRMRRISRNMLSKDDRVLIDSCTTEYFLRVNIDGLEYHIQERLIYSPVYHYGYVVNFTATPGTYKKNLKVFYQFLSKLEFYNPLIRMSVQRNQSNK
jgi:hypothetical protein